MADKSDTVPTDPFSWSAGGSRINWSVSANVYREWENQEPNQMGDGDVVVNVPWVLSAGMLEDADKSDPEGALSVYCLRVGDELAYRIVMRREAMPLLDQRRCALLAAMMIGVEHGDEIRAAIASARSKASAG